MVKVKINNKSLYLDGYLKNNLDIVKKVIKKDWDMCFIIDGIEGAGKSVLAQQIAFYCDPTLNMSRIAFTPKEFQSCIMKADKFQAVVYDEAYQGLNSRSAMTTLNRTLISMMAQIRQKNLYVFIVIPNFWELDKYIALWRSRALFHVYTSEGYERGNFSFYNIKKKKQLYIAGKKTYQYFVKPNFRGRFTKGYMVDEKEYREKKLQSLTEEVSLGADSKFLLQRDSLVMVLLDNKWGHKRIAQAMNKYSNTEFTKGGITNIWRKYERNNKTQAKNIE